MFGHRDRYTASMNVWPHARYSFYILAALLWSMNYYATTHYVHTKILDIQNKGKRRLGYYYSHSGSSHSYMIVSTESSMQNKS